MPHNSRGGADDAAGCFTMKLFHCVVVMGAAMTGSCGGQATTGDRTLRGDGAATDGPADTSIGLEGGDENTGALVVVAWDTSEAGPPEAGADRASCCGDAGADGGGPCFDYSTFPPHQWSCVSYEPPLGCTCNIVVAIL